ncbi:hypothetical protein EDC18_103138 [Natranaerovirga pectinivora]|uniref:Uncharacterized protein n=1 Tax=Natranaerovirga pectinivora TaxID=682400 RepID=A0A4R3MMB1_9FIRM|nr:hypothetical protein EDC18_103138 [Natranaerovirga pectinivora]
MLEYYYKYYYLNQLIHNNQDEKTILVLEDVNILRGEDKGFKIRKRSKF